MLRISFVRLKNLSILQLIFLLLIATLYVFSLAWTLSSEVESELYESVLFSTVFTFYSLPLFFALILCLMQLLQSMERIRLTKWMEFKVNLCYVTLSSIVSSLVPILSLLILAIYRSTTQFLVVGLMLEVYARYFMMFMTIGIIQYFGTLWLKNKWYIAGFLMITIPCFAFLYYIKTDFGNFFKFAFFYLTPPAMKSGHSVITIIPFFLGSILLLGSLCYLRLINQEYLS